MSSYFGVGYKHADLMHTGGNMMTDGFHMAASSTLVYEENSKMSKREVNSVMKSMWGKSTPICLFFFFFPVLR